MATQYETAIAGAQTEGQVTAERIKKALKLNYPSQQYVLNYASKVLEHHRKFDDIMNKFDAIDVAYARYQAKKVIAEQEGSGIDTIPEGQTGCGNCFDDDDVIPPIVVAQVDSFVAYLSEVFLTGSPLFPVVSNPTNKAWAEKLEVLLDDHAQLGKYTRQLALFIRNAVKYNFSAIELDWTSIEKFSVADSIETTSGRTVDRSERKFTKLKNLNVRNTVWDASIAPGDVAEHGDYAGYVERLSRMKLKRLLNKWTKEGKVYNADKAMGSAGVVQTAPTINYREDPQISDYIDQSTTRGRDGLDWEAWMDNRPSKRGNKGAMGAVYEIFYLYARIMPADFGITAPGPNTPQIWKFAIVNNNCMVYASRVISAYDYLPILFGQPLEDGLNYQTQSVAEGEIPFQKAAATLFNIRFAAARRAVSDRALYIPDMIKPSDINSPVPAPKIPVHISALSNKKIGDAYAQIPFDMRGTETTIQDAATIVQFSNQLHGVNAPRQGMFQKGNKSVKEWDDTMGSSDGRMRMPALILEAQVFTPMKDMMKLNIFQYGEDAEVTSQVSGETLDVKMNELRQQVLTFRIADGYTPKAKLANTGSLTELMGMINQSPILQQAYGGHLPGMFSHFATLLGIKGFDQYDPRSVPAPVIPGLEANVLQPGQAAPAQATQQPTLPVA